jgi:hypothetical protein
VPFLDFPPEVRRVIYTTNQIEALNSSLRKLLHYRGHFPDDKSVTKLLYLALRRFEKKWTRALWNWKRRPRTARYLLPRQDTHPVNMKLTPPAGRRFTPLAAHSQRIPPMMDFWGAPSHARPFLGHQLIRRLTPPLPVDARIITGRGSTPCCHAQQSGASWTSFPTELSTSKTPPP